MKFIDKYLIQESVPVPKMLEAFNIYMVKKIDEYINTWSNNINSFQSIQRLLY